MEKIKVLKKKLHCEKCREKYSEESKPYVHDRCKHHTCRSCLKDDPYSYHGGRLCPICGIETKTKEAPFAADVSIAVQIYESSMASRDQVEQFLRNEISSFKQKQAQLEAERNHKCAECGEKDSEQKMYICENCTVHDFYDENLDDIEKIALCAVCTINSHIRKGHETVDFFPYLSAHQFSLFSEDISSKSEEYTTSENMLKESMTDFNVLSKRVTENIDALTDMARRSKSSKYQIEAIERMELFIDESKAVNLKMDSELKENTKTVQENLTKLKEWFATRADSCVEESEIIKLSDSDNDSDI